MPWFLVGDDHGYDGRDESAHGDHDANNCDLGAMLQVTCNERGDARHLDGNNDGGSQQAVHYSLVERGDEHGCDHDARGDHDYDDHGYGDRDDDPRDVRHLLLGYLSSHIHYTLLNLNILNH
ncbi:hypothetical protein [Photobacterium leiognathi]|uniref:hypothetical protein n=1 Tax=Photobacterium leiognathi TaxID=553611 RepID=UPI002158E11E|nr:hypothetical protein [Photobacterium leiognathi]